MHDTPNIKGGERVTWAAAIVLVCILVYGLVTILWTSFSPTPAPSDLHVDAGCF